MTDIVERLRIIEPDAPGSKSHCFRNPDGPEAADEIEQLREALQSTCKIVELMCKAFKIEPEDFVINVSANKENGETRIVRSISAQEVLGQARSALGEKE